MMQLKILSIIDSGIIGGPGRGLFQLVRHSNNKLCQFIIANFKYRNPKSTEFIDAVRKQNLPLKLFTQRFRFDPLPFFEVKKIVSEENISIIQTHGYKGHLIGWVAAKFLGIKWVAWAHGWTTEDLKVRLFHTVDLFSLRYADMAVAVSQPLFLQLKKIRGVKRTELVLNAVDIDFIPGESDHEEVRSQYNLTEDKKVVAVIGRLSSEKGQRFLFEAIKLLAHRIANIKLLVIGDGPDRAQLEKWVSENSLSEVIIFTGYQSEVRKFYSTIDLLVIPSLSEGLPNVLLEAMALAVPVVSTSVGEVPAIISNGDNGWIVPKADSKALADAIEIALSSKELRDKITQAAKLLIEGQFSPKKRADKVTALYQDLISSQ